MEPKFWPQSLFGVESVEFVNTRKRSELLLGFRPLNEMFHFVNHCFEVPNFLAEDALGKG